MNIQNKIQTYNINKLIHIIYQINTYYLIFFLKLVTFV